MNNEWRLKLVRGQDQDKIYQGLNVIGRASPKIKWTFTKINLGIMRKCIIYKRKRETIDVYTSYVFLFFFLCIP